jgi:hypothetical protein
MIFVSDLLDHPARIELEATAVVPVRRPPARRPPAGKRRTRKR